MMCTSTVTSAPSPQDGRRPMFKAILWMAASCSGSPGPASSCAHLHAEHEKDVNLGA